MIGQVAREWDVVGAVLPSEDERWERPAPVRKLDQIDELIYSDHKAARNAGCEVLEASGLHRVQGQGLIDNVNTRDRSLQRGRKKCVQDVVRTNGLPGLFGLDGVPTKKVIDRNARPERCVRANGLETDFKYDHLVALGDDEIATSKPRD